MDSVVTEAHQVYKNNYFSASTPKRFKTELDYKIRIISIGQVFTLTGFETERINCYKCKQCQVIFGKADNYWYRLHYYLVNGQRQQSETFKIFK
jgi:hypothetical protein